MPIKRRLSLPFDGEKARMVRERRGLRLRDLSDRTEKAGDRIAVSLLCRYENGEYRPNARRLMILASALDCTIDDLLTPAGEVTRECA